MRNTGYLVMGGLLILFGIMLILGQAFQINFWAICWPVGLILLGVWLLVRPKFVPAGEVNISPLADIHRSGPWAVAPEEFWTFVGDVDLDMTQADLPAGETRLRLFGFVNDIDLYLPPGVGFSLASTAFLSEARLLGKKQESFFIPLEFTSPDYDLAERRVRLEVFCFVADLKVKQVKPTPASPEQT
ncbi:MAG: cell wall-active antibiotics response protein [Anaerolineales bacterium]|nr:cell wall-active antibiotics response protein [Anaerolineales bacterium]